MATGDKYPLDAGEVPPYTDPPPPTYSMPLQEPPVMMQPVPPMMSQTTVVAVSPAVEVKPPYPQRVRPWTTGLCDCFSDMGVCLCGFFCPICLGCQVSSHMGENCCTCYCCGPLPLRVKLRSILGIGGDIWTDCCVSCCCTSCALCQMEREMKNWGM